LNKPFDEELQTGDGYQMWETIYSYGSPVTPVFKDPNKLLNYIYKNGLCEPYDKLTGKAAQAFLLGNNPVLWTYNDLKVLDPTGGKISRTIAPLSHFYNCLCDKHIDKTLKEKDFIKYNTLIMIYTLLYRAIDNLVRTVFEFKYKIPNEIAITLVDYLQDIYSNNELSAIPKIKFHQIIEAYIKLDRKFNKLLKAITENEKKLPKEIREGLDNYREERKILYYNIWNAYK
jgi:hypothetical protein